MSIEDAVEMIENVLAKARACISNDLITFEMDNEFQEREKNERFMRLYIMSNNERLDTICNLKKENLCEICAERIKDVIKFDTLYVFGVEKDLINRETGKQERVPIYIKFQFFDFKNVKDAVLIISFHKAEQELKYLKW